MHDCYVIKLLATHVKSCQLLFSKESMLNSALSLLGPEESVICMFHVPHMNHKNYELLPSCKKCIEGVMVHFNPPTSQKFT